MLLLGGVLLAVSMFVGRTYCRFICPYGVLLRILSPLSRWRVSISPAACVDCRLCEQSCPFGAIRTPTRHKPRADRGARQWLVITLTLLPLIIGLFVLVGWRAGDTLARTHPTVKLADKVSRFERAPTDPVIDEVQAFRNTGQPAAGLYADARIVQHRFAIGTSLMGAWMGLVIGLKLVGSAIRRTSNDYTADAGTCLACARCYRHCPVEQQRRVEEVVPV